MVPSASDHTIFAVDVEGFGDRRRTDPVLVAVRAAVHEVVLTAFEKAGVPWDRCFHEGCGDGLFVVIPSDVPKRLLGAPLPRELAAAVREHNGTCQENAHMRLRAAVHAGQVRRDAHGVAGTAVNLTFRLLNADPLRSALAQSPGVLALIASDWFFDDVIRHDPASDPGSYRRVRVSVKETKRWAWISCPDSPHPPTRARRKRVVQALVASVTLAGVVTAASGTLTSRDRSPEPPVAQAPPTTTTSTSPSGGPAEPEPEGEHTPDGDAHPTRAPAPGTTPGQGSTPGTPRPSSTPTGTPETQPSMSEQRSVTTYPVQEERTVQLSNTAGQESVEIDWWRQNHDRTGDLQVDTTGAFTTLGAELAVVDDSSETTRDQCMGVTTWSTRVDFAKLHVGSQLCARSVGGRYAMLRVTALPDSPGSGGRFVFYGRTWKL